jgi:hypothetical protein
MSISDALTGEIRSQELRVDDVKCIVREQDTRQEHIREQQRQLEMEKATWLKDVAQVKREEEDSRHQVLVSNRR